jgi:hypothetical protein
MKKLLLILIHIIVGYFGLRAQNILLDKPVLAASLTLFPDITNPNVYYFLPNKLRLGIGTDGKPQFSFLRFVQNVRTEAGEEVKREGDGGGVVHAVVELYVSDEQKKDAERELKRVSKNAEATIVGPVIYKSGTMSLVSSIANEKGGYAKSVIGLGPAPLLVGNKAAVSVLLTKDGSKILWESFKTTAPDMSFSFVMSVSGFRTPLNAKIEVDYEKIYQSESFSVGVKLKTKTISNSNRNNGQQQNSQNNTNPTPATNGGSNPAPATNGGSNPAPATNGGSNPTPATNGGANPAPATNGGSNPAPATNGGSNPTPATNGGSNPAPATNGGANPAPATNGGANPTPATNGGANPTPATNGTPRRNQVASAETNDPTINDINNHGSLNAFFDYDPKWMDIIANFDELVADEQVTLGDESSFYVDAELRMAFEEMRQKGEIKVSGPAMDAQGEKILEIAYSKLIDQMFEPVTGGSSSTQDMNSILQMANQRNGDSNTTINNTGNVQAPQETDGTKTSIGVTVAYQFKKIKKSGSFKLDLNRSLSDEIQFRFDENFGKLNCKECFRQVNLDDPMFRQREIQVSLDGLNADQFKKYINFTTISLKKTHGNNDITTDEVRVGADDFDKKANVYRLLYGWKDEKDADKNRWLKYEYKTIWSMFGDYTIEGDWKSSDAFGINVAPPVRPISIDVEASADLLKAAQVRSANVKFYYNYGGGEKVEQINIRTDAAVTAAKVELLLAQNQYDYEYEITWRLTGNKEVKSGRQKSNSTMLYVDELPK